MESELSITCSSGVFRELEKKNVLFYSERPTGFIIGKRRLVSDLFAQHFISDPRFEAFFSTFGQHLSNLKQLQLCGLSLNEKNITAFAQILNSFQQLEELAFFDFGYSPDRKRTNEREDPRRTLELHLPRLRNLRLEQVDKIEMLILVAPNLKELTACSSSAMDLDIRHGESVEKLFVDNLEKLEVKQLINLNYLDTNGSLKIDSTFLDDLPHLKEIHLNDRLNVPELFKQKQRCGRGDLKIYLLGYLLNDPDDRAIGSLSYPEYLDVETFACLAWANDSRLANELPIVGVLDYTAIERVPPGLAIDVMNRLTRLDHILVVKRIEHPVHIRRFLDFLKRFQHIVALEFSCDQPQELFDGLPEHCAVQWLTIYEQRPDFEFLFRLHHLVYLSVTFSVNTEFIRRALQELRFLSYFSFKYNNRNSTIKLIQIQFKDNPNPKYQVWAGRKRSKGDLDLDAAIRFIAG